MNEDLHNQQLPLPAEVGWEQMQQLLNQHLPVTKQTSFQRSRPFFAAALVAGILLFASLELDQYSIPHFNNISTSHFPVNKKATGLTSCTTKDAADNSNNISSATTARDKNNSDSILIAADKNQLTSDYFNINLPAIDPMNNSQRRILYTEFEKHQIEKTNPSMIILPKVIPAAVDQRKGDDKKTNNPWAISIGVGQNFSINNNQQFHPYVVAEISKQMTPRLSVATGIDAYSSVSSNAKGITKTVYVNDLVNNIQLYNEITEYSKLNYIDVPLSAGLRISENLSLQTGVQASFLVSKKKRQDPVSYDYQMNPLSLPASPPPTTAAAPQQQDFSLSVRTVDYRLLGGIRYTNGNTSVALTYQHGLQPVLKGNRLSSEGNRVVALKLLYKIK